jgi:hypothetical protein
MAFKVKFDKEFKAFQDYIKTLNGPKGKKVIQFTPQVFAKQARLMVQRAYQSAGYDRHPGTIAAYTEPSARKSSYTGTKSLIRSGTLAKSVSIKRIRPGAWKTWIDPSIKYTGADYADVTKSVAAVADRLESGRIYTVKVTVPMLRYLHMLAKKHPWPSKHGGTLKVGGSMAVTLRQKPVWEPVWKAMRREMKKLGRKINILFGRRSLGKAKFPK